MEDLRFGAAIRAARVRRRWRQEDLAAAAGVSRATTSRIERGLVDEIAIGIMRRVAAALEIRVELLPRSRSGDLDRLVNGRHAALAEAVVRWFASFPGWTVRPEVSFAHFGERGVIDLLAWHAATRTLLVIELKTDIVDVGELIATLGRKVRLAPVAAAPLGWEPRTVASGLVVADSTANRQRVRAFEATFRAAYPADGRTLRRWLANPGSILAAPPGASRPARLATGAESGAPFAGVDGSRAPLAGVATPRPPLAGVDAPRAPLAGLATPRPPLAALVFFRNDRSRSVAGGFATVRRVRPRSTGPSKPRSNVDRADAGVTGSGSVPPQPAIGG